MKKHVLPQFATDDEVLLQEAALARASGEDRLDTLIALCWHLRQRDCQRALLLAAEAETLLQPKAATDTSAQRSLARLTLVRAEIRTLFADLDSAESLARAAIDAFEALGDRIGTGDGHFLLTTIGNERGNYAQVSQSLQQAQIDYESAGEPHRIAAAQARSLANRAFGDTAGAAAGLATHFPAHATYDEAVMALVAVAQANVAGLTDDPSTAIKFDMQAYQAALKSGQIRQAMVCAVNTAESFATLGELDAAMEWSERALTTARSTGWPVTTGVCLMQMGDVMRLLDRTAEARALLQEALQVMGAMTGSRNYENVLCTLGQLELDDGMNAQALRWFAQSEQHIDTQSQSDILMKSLRGQATALTRLGRADDAQAKANEALMLAREHSNADEQIRALRVFAELHHAHTLPPPADMFEASAELHFLTQALAIAATIKGYSASVDLLNQVGHAYAHCGLYQAAYEYGLAATEARTKAGVVEAESRALAMQIRHEVDRARADTEHHRKLAATLEATNATLETLGQIGREITGSLDAGAVFATLHRHVDNLLDATTFYIYTLDPDGEGLSMTFGVEAGAEVALTARFAMDDPASLTARCARERREIVIKDASEKKDAPTLPGTMATHSMLFAPIEVGNRLIGVITIQSPKANAYSERECSLFRTLCAYGAIALDNAAAYSSVEAARQRSELQEQQLRIAATAFESLEGLLITDSDRNILQVNGAFTKITGYSRDEVIGHQPSMFRSERHDTAFYDAIFEAVHSAGNWQGEIWIRRKSGEAFPLWLSIAGVRSAPGLITNLVYALSDITDRKLAEDEIRNLAFYDPLTQLPNRRLLMDRLRHALASSERSGLLGALLFVDLDNFKKLNDTRGHDVGDLLLTEVAQRLSDSLRQGDTAARLGGDEFVILLEGLSTDNFQAAERAEATADRALVALNETYLLKGQIHHSTPSIGLCLFQGQTETVDELLKQADLAMYQAKAAGRNTIRFFNPEMQAAVSAHAALEADMRQALEAEQFVLYYQPQVDVQGRTLGAEALVRWRHPLRGMVSPGSFIPLAEETGLIQPLGEWVLEAGCRQLTAWALNPETEHLSLAINISARQFHDADFVANVLLVLGRTKANPHRLKLELTESLLLKDVETVIAKMHTLIGHGVRFSLDDFGTGYSSLSYLKRLPLEQLKIDQSFVRDIFIDSNDLAIVRAVVTLGHSLGLAVIAEGVETDEQRQFLESSGCREFQGYLFGKPVPVVDFLVRR